MAKIIFLSFVFLIILDECQSEGLRSDFNDNNANTLVKNHPTLMEIFAKLRRKLRKGKDTSLGDIDDISNDSGSQQEDLDFLINHGHLQTVLHRFGNMCNRFLS
uniref:Uncharacterized protein n=1 Tax=Acrobeloides nanus TaxID=290746 RepID=A0A914EDA3_9BILA